LQNIHDECAACTRCKLCQTRKHVVPGSGSPTAQVVFIGEGPGAQEDAKGLPFVGASGKFLDEMLGSIGLKRDDVFIANVVKCRPPNNRDPEKEEILACMPFLQRQIKVIAPKIIVTLGRFSMQLFLPDAKISQIHGKVQKVGEFVILPLFHPAAALFNGSMRGVLKDDFLVLGKLLSGEMNLD